MKPRKVIKRISLTLLGLLVILMIAIAILLNFIFTPDKITPKALEIANENLSGKVACERIELTFFSSFPHFGLEFNEGALLPNSVYHQQDTLVQFKKAKLSFNIYKFLNNKTVDIKNLQLDQPRLYFYLDSLGGSNWNILKPITDTIVKSQDSSEAIQLNDVHIRNLEINHAQARYEDGLSKLNYEINDFNLNLKAAKTKEGLSLNVNNFSNQIAIYKNPKKRYKINKIAVKSNLHFSFADTTLHVNQSDVAINDIHFLNQGQIKFYPHQKQSFVELESKLTTNSLENILALIPSRFLSKQEVFTKGNLDLLLDIKGFYDKDRYPQVHAKMKLEDASLAYKNFPGKIDLLNTEVSSEFNWDNPQNSFIDIQKLQVTGSGIDLNTSGSIQQVLHNPLVNLKLDADLDLSYLYKQFPVDKNIQTSGEVHTHIESKFYVLDLQNSHFENIDLKGKINLENFSFHSIKDSISLQSKNLEALFYKQKDNYQTLAAKLDFTETAFHFKKELKTSAQNLTGRFMVEQTGKRKANLKGDLVLKKFKIQTKDSVKGFIQNAKIKAQLYPKGKEHGSYITSQFIIDSIALVQNKSFAAIRQGSYMLRLDKKGKKKWAPEGKINFKQLTAYDPKFQHRLKMPASTIEFKNDNFTLNQTQLIFGETDVTLTGEILHARGFKTGETVKANVGITSNYINTNELMQVFSSSEEGSRNNAVTFSSINNIQKPTDSLPQEKHAFKIPEYLEFNLTVNAKELKFGEMQLKDIQGAIAVNEGVVALNKFHLKTMAANLDANLTYQFKNTEDAKLDFQFYLSEIEMSQLNEVLPVLDSLLPSTQSFEGKADFRIKGNVALTKNLNFKLKTLKGVAALKAKNIMVLDGPTFRELAKTFMFKSKEKNPIKNLEVEIEFKENDAHILPALLEIDRYRLALGGTQRLDMSYDYHISVLKSPVPFKTGVDVSGKDFEDYDIKITTAKYKYYFTDKDRLLKKVDSSVIRQKKSILDELDY